MIYTRRKFSEAYACAHEYTGGQRHGTYQFKKEDIPVYTRIDYRPGLITKHAEYSVMYHKDRDVIGIYFQGTADIGDWSANLTTTTKTWGKVKYNGKTTKIEIHKGWYNMYNAMKKHIHKDFEAIRKEYPNAEVETVGHSLGAGMAQVCAVDLYETYGVKTHNFTFGSVKPFKVDDVGKMYLLSCVVEAYNFCDVNDVVCYMPPFDGFVHINPVWLDFNAAGTDWKIDTFVDYHFVYDIEILYEKTDVYKDGVSTLATNKVF